ncbi:MAG: glycosyltransferase [Lachnospiraceae bacterium]|nr:glycosyltransferase [Lachnospiraceae bacterium]
MEKDIVSVIIPVYNCEKYIERCLSSVTGQTYTNLEILVIIDGAVDNSFAICRSLACKDSRIRIIEKENEGPGIARNLGIRSALGEYITFVDADDSIEKCFIKKLMRSMKENDSDMSLCDIYYCDRRTGDKTISKIRFDEAVKSFRSDRTVINKVRTFVWGKLYKKNLFDDKCLFPGHTFEDIPVSAMLACKARAISYIDEPMYYYYRNMEHSLSADADNIGDISKALELLHNRFAQIGMMDAVNPEIKKLMLGQLRFAFVRWGKPGKKCGANVKTELDNINKLVEKYYPGAGGFADKKYYVEQKDLQMAVSHVAVDASQYTASPEQADYVISRGRLGSNSNKNIVIPMSYGEDEDFDDWGAAEYIMENM